MMPDRDSTPTQIAQLIGAPDRRLPGETHRSYGLPPDMQRRALSRLTGIAAVWGVMMAISVTANAIIHFGWGAMPLPPSTVVVRLLALATSAAMVLVARYAPWELQTKLNVGVVYSVVTAGCIAFLEPDMIQAFGLPIGTISTVSLWILIFHLVVPVRPLHAAISVFSAAATVPIANYMVDYLGVVQIPPLVITGLIKTTFGTAAVAWVAARYVYQLGTEVTAARRLGSYQLEERLGQGGMGEVWRASHASLKRPAAIKLIQPEVLGATDTESREVTLKRFEQEAQATAALQSPHTVTLFDFGSNDDGTFYYAMELLNGLDLETLVDRYGPQPPERAAFLLEQVCYSLMEAHELGLVHRDIKPANVFVCCLGPHCDFAKVLDFGLVKHTDDLSGVDPQLTREGMTTGTPAYMSPEMALGEPIDLRSDLYQVGCLAYWLLTGKLVFEGKTAMAMLTAHIHDEAPPVSDRTEFEVDEALESLVADCLAKKPDDRPASAREVLERLEEAGIARGWTAERARRWWKVHQPEVLRAGRDRAQSTEPGGGASADN